MGKRRAYLQVAECLDASNLTKWKASQKHPPSPNQQRRQHRRKVPRNQRRKPHLRRQKRRKLPKRRPRNRSLRKQQQRNQLLKSLLRRKSSVCEKVDFTGPFQGH